MKKILCFVDYYIPGYRAGGPTRTIENLVSHLGGVYEFFIVTRDRDLGSSTSYENVQIDKWSSVGKAKVFYASKKMFSLLGFRKIIEDTAHDILYLNSFFSAKTTVKILFLRRFGLILKKPIILAPRGEFSAGALSLKSKKKKIYIAASKSANLYEGIVWQASSDIESKDIRLNLGLSKEKVMVAPDLLPADPIKLQKPEKGDISSNKSKKFLRLVFLSRISPMKNLDYLIKILSFVKVPVKLAIYGPCEDKLYWSVCQSLISKLPGNIVVTYKGDVAPDKVSNKFSAGDVFFFPTKGENFGHVVFESLSAGTCVVISDQTTWIPDKEGAVEVIPLEEFQKWVGSLEKWFAYNDEELSFRRRMAVSYAKNYLACNDSIDMNQLLFDYTFYLKV